MVSLLDNRNLEFEVAVQIFKQIRFLIIKRGERVDRLQASLSLYLRKWKELVVEGANAD
jgi:hypothetical protein